MCAMACMWKQKTTRGTWSFVLSGIKRKESDLCDKHLYLLSHLLLGRLILMTVVLERVLLSKVG